MTRASLQFSAKHIAVWLCLAVILVVLGCGGGGSSVSTTLTGKSAIRSIAISSYQTQVAASKFILPALIASAPSGSQLGGLGGGTAFLKSKPKAFGGLTYDQYSGLYLSSAIVGPTLTISFFSDAAGTTSAGSIAVTIENATSFNTNYLSYPAKIDIVGNITAGNIPGNGKGQIVFTDASGANTITGTLFAPVRGVNVSLNMSLSPSGSVGGSITIVQNGLTTQVTGLSGDLATGFSGAAVANPGNLTGTANIDLLKETLTLSLSSGTLSSNTTVDGSGNLTTTYNDGTSLNLSNTLSQSPDGPPTSSTGTTSGTTSTTAGTSTSTTAGGTGSLVYGSPVTIPGSASAEIIGVNQNHQMVGSDQRNSTAIPSPLYWSSPTSSPIVLQLISGELGGYACSINASGAIVGYGNPGGVTTPIYWSNSSATATPLAVTSDLGRAYATSINDNGNIVGFGYLGSFNIKVPLYWANSQAIPIKLPCTGSVLAIQINNSGQILMGDVDFASVQSTVGSSGGYAEFLNSPTQTSLPVVLTDADGSTLLDATYPLFDLPVYGLNASGTVTGWTDKGTGGVPVTWKSNSASPSVLPSQSGQFYYAFASNDSGATVGVMYPTGHNAGTVPGDKAVIWLGAQGPVSIASLISGTNTANIDGFLYGGTRGAFLFNDYSYIGIDYSSSNVSQQPYVFIPATKHP